MRISAAGLELIRNFEGFRETAVRLPDGRWTIGHGHVRTAREGLTISPKDAEQLLLHDLAPIEQAISAMVYAPLMQGQFDALVSLAFNISLGQLHESGIIRHMNSGDYLAAAAGFDQWRKARLQGRLVVVDALVRRRAAEKALFLEHPNGPPAAPTPLVTPEREFGGQEPPQRSHPAPHDERADEDIPGDAVMSPAGTIAEAVRRLAERTQEAILPTPEIPLPPGAAIAAADEVEDVAFEEAPIPEMPPASAVEAQPNPAVTAEGIARASRTVAERVSSILNGVQSKIDSHEAEGAAAGPGAAEDRPRVREGMPDFEAPAERTQTPARGGRRLIDDTEIVEPGRDPSQLFAEGERRARVVNGHARRVGPISGRMLALAPWIMVLVLSIIGLAVGAVEGFKADNADPDAPRLAATILAVFGVMLVMSLYFIVMKRTTDES